MEWIVFTQVMLSSRALLEKKEAIITSVKSPLLWHISLLHYAITLQFPVQKILFSS